MEAEVERTYSDICYSVSGHDVDVLVEGIASSGCDHHNSSPGKDKCEPRAHVSLTSYKYIIDAALQNCDTPISHSQIHVTVTRTPSTGLLLPAVSDTEFITTTKARGLYESRSNTISAEHRPFDTRTRSRQAKPTFRPSKNEGRILLAFH